MIQDKPKKKTTKIKKVLIDKKVAETIKIMASTPPISNEEIIKRSKKRKR